MIEDATISLFVVSDSIGETAEQLARAASKHFSNYNIQFHRFSHVETKEQINDVILHAKQSKRCIIVFTLVIPKLRDLLAKKARIHGIATIDLLWPTINSLSRVIGYMPHLHPGILRKVDDNYFKRIEAIEFAVKFDDGQNTQNLEVADIVLIGVSRTSKTPLSIYLAYKNYKVANIPIVPNVPLPKELYAIPKNKIIGLTSDPQIIKVIRTKRAKVLGLARNQSYANLNTIINEVTHAKRIMQEIGCKIIDTTNRAIEETASTIIEFVEQQ